jgi:hypothetical protein
VPGQEGNFSWNNTQPGTPWPSQLIGFFGLRRIGTVFRMSWQATDVDIYLVSCSIVKD